MSLILLIVLMLIVGCEATPENSKAHKYEIVIPDKYKNCSTDEECKAMYHPSCVVSSGTNLIAISVEYSSDIKKEKERVCRGYRGRYIIADHNPSEMPEAVCINSRCEIKQQNSP